MKEFNDNVIGIINYAFQAILGSYKIWFKSLPEAYPIYVNLPECTTFYRNLFKFMSYPAGLKVRQEKALLDINSVLKLQSYQDL